MTLESRTQEEAQAAAAQLLQELREAAETAQPAPENDSC